MEKLNSEPCKNRENYRQQSASDELTPEVLEEIKKVVGHGFAGIWLSSTSFGEDQINIAANKEINISKLPKISHNIKIFRFKYSLSQLELLQSQITQMILEPESKILSVAVNVPENKVEVRTLARDQIEVKDKLGNRKFDMRAIIMEVQDGTIQLMGKPSWK